MTDSLTPYVETVIGVPMLTSTPLCKRRPAAPILSYLSAPPDHVPTFSAVHPLVSPTYAQLFNFTRYHISPDACFPQAVSTTYHPPTFVFPSSPGYLTKPLATTTIPVISPIVPFQDPSTTDDTSQVDSSLYHTLPALQSKEVQTSPNTEYKMVDSLLLPACSTLKPNIDQLIDNIISQVLG